MPSIFKRRLIKIGNGGLAITIPKAWVDYYRLKPRDIVTIKANKKLVLCPDVTYIKRK